MMDNSQIPATSESELRADHITLLLNQISNLDRGPKGLKTAWAQRAAQGAGGSSTAQILLEAGGFGVWLAFTCAKLGAEKGSRFAGKAACRDLVADLAARSPGYLKLLATSVRGRIDPAVCAKVEKLRKTRIETRTGNMSQPNKRGRGYSIERLLLF